MTRNTYCIPKSIYDLTPMAGWLLLDLCFADLVRRLKMRQKLRAGEEEIDSPKDLHI